jgi:hypothetical protein
LRLVDPIHVLRLLILYFRSPLEVQYQYER